MADVQLRPKATVTAIVALVVYVVVSVLDTKSMAAKAAAEGWNVILIIMLRLGVSLALAYTMFVLLRERERARVWEDALKEKNAVDARAEASRPLKEFVRVELIVNNVDRLAVYQRGCTVGDTHLSVNVGIKASSYGPRDTQIRELKDITVTVRWDGEADWPVGTNAPAGRSASKTTKDRVINKKLPGRTPSVPLTEIEAIELDGLNIPEIHESYFSGTRTMPWEQVGAVQVTATLLTGDGSPEDPYRTWEGLVISSPIAFKVDHTREFAEKVKKLNYMLRRRGVRLKDAELVFVNGQPSAWSLLLEANVAMFLNVGQSIDDSMEAIVDMAAQRTDEAVAAMRERERQGQP